MSDQNKFDVSDRRIAVPFRSLVVLALLVLSGVLLAATMEKMTDPAKTEKSGSRYQEGPRITSVYKHSLGEGIKAKRFYAAVANDKNEIWFLTDAGMISGALFNTRIENSKIPLKDLKNLVFESTSDGPGMWISTPQGAIFSSIPVSEDSRVINYDISNSKIQSNNVLAVAVGKNHLRWFATDKGISALYDNKWLPGDYKIFYPESLFQDYPITAMATSGDGDTLYAATEGVGVSRFFRNNVDAVTGASQFAQWGPIEMPSDSVYSICITPDGTQWIGTSQGVCRHIGFNSLEKWTVFNMRNGLINNFVKAIAADQNGNIWCGTKGGVSVYNGASWVSFTMKDGLISNNILFIMADMDGIVYLGTDNGIMVYKNGQLYCYQ
jgi:ligand-binding sensor domain-containing protein